MTDFEKGLEQYIKENYKPLMALFVGGKYNDHIMSVDTLKSLPDFTGRLSHNYEKEWCAGGCVPRRELWDQPIIEGYLSPMWDGGMLRYETQEVYDLLSM